MSFSINLKTGEFKKSRLVSGPIWLEVEKQNFPSQQWNDFPVVILGWWLEAIADLVSKKAGSAKCLFMDGPYYFEVDATLGEIWGITLITNQSSGIKRSSRQEVTPKIVISETLRASQMVADFCRHRDWRSSDLSTLETQINNIDCMIKSSAEKR